jgi:cellulase/cellobiase CelA1
MAGGAAALTTASAGTAGSQTVAPYSAALLTLQPGSAPGTGSCRVGYSVNDWGSGFTAALVLTNTGTTPVNGWTLSFAWPGNQRLSNGWNATWTQSGSTVTGTSLSYNGSLAPGASTTVGFNAAYSGSNQPPSTFTLNGATCG